MAAERHIATEDTADGEDEANNESQWRNPFGYVLEANMTSWQILPNETYLRLGAVGKFRTS